MEYGFWSLVPPLLTIILALTTKNVFISLFVGILTGSFVLNAFSPLTSINAGLYAIVDNMSGSNVIIIGSILMIGAVIHLIEKSGGINGFVNVVVKNKGIIKTKRGANLFTWLLGLAVFTSGSLSCMVTGAVSRPVNDSMKVPHEKSAFIVHATSTPWCVLFPFSGWLASMVGYLVSGGVNFVSAIVLFCSSDRAFVIFQLMSFTASGKFSVTSVERTYIICVIICIKFLPTFFLIGKHLLKRRLP